MVGAPQIAIFWFRCRHCSGFSSWPPSHPASSGRRSVAAAMPKSTPAGTPRGTAKWCAPRARREYSNVRYSFERGSPVFDPSSESADDPRRHSGGVAPRVATRGFRSPGYARNPLPPCPGLYARFHLALARHFFLESRISSSVCFRTVVGLKLGGNDRGGNSLNVAANLKTSSIIP